MAPITAVLLLTFALGQSAGPPIELATPATLAAERARVLAAATAYLGAEPVTVTASRSPRSAGGLHDFFSEGDYWWPDPADPAGPYIQRDGMTNPDNFTAHRQALMRLSVQVPALVEAWRLTKDRRYADHAARHLRAWFVDPATMMNPSLLYAQAIHGRVTGRGTGVIDTIHLVEVARAIEQLRGAPGWTPKDDTDVRQWFSAYLAWITTHPYGIAERDAKNNHATCWVMQEAAFAHLTGNAALLADARSRFRSILVPDQMGPDGSFPLEMARTKPYGYSLFNLEALAAICQIADAGAAPADRLWTFTLPDGRGMRKAVAFMAPYIADRRGWPKPPDVMYDDRWPMRQNSLLFAAVALDTPGYIAIWSKLPADSDVEEVIRNFFIRQPLLWFD